MLSREVMHRSFVVGILEVGGAGQNGGGERESGWKGAEG